MAQEIAISLLDVQKKFGTHIVLDTINLEIQKGEVYGLVGRNGCGKTVLLKLITGFLIPSSGKIVVLGKHIGHDADFPNDVGFLIEMPGFLANESGINNLKYLASTSKKCTEKDIIDTMKVVNLDPKSKKKTGKYSLGMKQRLGIAQAIMEKPQILILDEPMNGLDKHGVEEMRNLFLEMKKKGCTILLASHNKDDIDILCDHVYELDAGIMEKIR